MNIKTNITLLLAGSLYALGFPNIINSSLLVTPIVSLVILFNILFKEKKLKSLIGKALIFCLGFNLTGYYWIADTIQEFGGLPYPVALLVNTLFSIIVMPYLWPVIILIFFLQKKKMLILNNGLKVFSVAILFTLVEFFTPQQFDSFLGSPWIIFSKYLGFASIAGVTIYSFFSFLVVFETMKFMKFRKVSKVNVIMVLLFIVLNPIISKTKDDQNKTLFNIRLVQGNISNFLKVESEKGALATSSQVINRYKDLSTRPYNEAFQVDLIIWPETAYPFSIIPEKNLEETLIPMAFNEVVQFTKADLLVGGYESIHNNNLYMSDYNTAFHINSLSQIEKTYNKKVLIPFGETLPFGIFNKYLSAYFKNIAFFAEGTKATVFNFNKGVNGIATICYEVLKTNYIRSYLNETKEKIDIMINLTNDSWYGDTLEPYQHLFLSKWRSVEYDIPIIRSTNTGISSVINRDGTESERTNLFKAENLDLQLEITPRTATLYQRYGISLIYLLFILGLIFHYLGLKLKNEK